MDKLTVKVGDTFKLSDYVEKSPDTLAIGAADHITIRVKKK